MNPPSFFPPFFMPPKQESIVDVIGPEMSQMKTGNPMMDEIQIYGGLYQQKMLEKSDRNEVMNVGRRGLKLFLLSLVVGGAVNRMFTKVKIGKYDFLNMRLVFRLIIRLGIFGISFGMICLSPVLNHLMKIRDDLNMKYVPRMIRYQKEMDPLVMNPSLLNEPGMTDEEREYMRVFYENMRSQAAMMKAQSKMMEEKEKSMRR